MKKVTNFNDVAKEKVKNLIQIGCKSLIIHTKY